MTRHLKVAALGLFMAMLMIPFLMAPSQALETGFSGYVFLDTNGDGLRGPDERPVEGASITLLRTDGEEESYQATVRSDALGIFRMPNPGAGEYRLDVRLPGNLLFTVPAPGGSRALPASGGEGRTLPFTLVDGEGAVIPIGATQRSAYLNVIAFGDESANGGRFSSEPLLRDVEILLLYEYEGERHVVARAVTDREGFAQLRDLTPATYRMEAVLPSPYIAGPLGAKMTAFYNTVLPAGENRGVTEPFNLERSMALGVGGIQAGSVSGSVWHDADMDGQKDVEDGAYPGIALTLIHKKLGLTQTLTTDDSSAFHFDYLQPGEYILTADLPDGVMFARQGSGSSFTHGYSATASISVSVAAGLDTDVGSVGTMAASSVTVVAFHDTDADGIPDEGEPAFLGAQVEALEDGQPMASAATDAKGWAVLPRVRDGSALLRVTLPDGQVFSAANPQGSAFASLRAASSLTAAIHLAPGGAQTLYAGVTLPASVSGQVFDDANLSGRLDAGEGLLAGFPVTAVAADGRVAAEAVSGADGAFLLDTLIPGTYSIRIVPPSPYVFSGLSQTGMGTENAIAVQSPAYGETLPFTLGGGEERINVDAGAFRSAVIGGSMLLGDEELGTDGSLGGIADVLIELLDENGIPVSEHTTARTLADGSFSLKGALPGTYILRYTLPGGVKFSSPLTDESQLLSGAFSVRSSEELTFPPLYAVRTGALSGTAFYDADNDGALGGADPALPDAALSLVNKRTGETYASASGVDGSFEISGIRPGRYTLRVRLPDGFLLDHHPDNPLGPSLTGEAEADFLVGMGGETRNRLLPAVRPVAIKGYSFFDNDLNGAFDASMDTPCAITFTLTHRRTGIAFAAQVVADGSFSVPTAFPGQYALRLTLPEDHFVLAPQDSAREGNTITAQISLSGETADVNLAVVQWGSIGGAVWNLDGSGAAVAGIPVQLLSQSGETAAQTETDAAGAFFFDSLLPGTYRLHATLTEDFRFARERDTANRTSAITAEAAGKDASAGSGNAFALLMGEQKEGLDIGIGAMGKLGDYAWLDLDGDGMQDAGEPGYPGVEVIVTQYGEEVAKAVTDAYGHYVVSGLYPGAYVVKAAVPAGVRPTAVQTDFPLVASILTRMDGFLAVSAEVRVPGGGRNLSADLGFVPLKGTDVSSLFTVPQKDWTRVNEQKPAR